MKKIYIIVIVFSCLLVFAVTAYLVYKKFSDKQYSSKTFDNNHACIARRIVQDKSEAQAFTEIYDKNVWGKGSGPGSDPQQAKVYLPFLQKYLNNPAMHSILDLGCGDWQLMSTLTIPDSKVYTGFDLVKSVIEENIKKHKKNNVNFQLIHNILDFQSQHGDLLVVKDVIQHWPNDQIQYLLKNILPNFKYALITNDFKPSNSNQDIKFGDFRCIDLQAVPFNVGKEFQVVFDYPSAGIVKRVYLYTNPASSK